MLTNRHLEYQSEEKGPYSNFNLNKLSPMTKYVLKVSKAAFENKKNVILIDSHRNYNVSLILAYRFATRYQKSVYINLGDSASSNLNNDYYLMSSHIPAYRSVPIGIIDEDGNFDVRPYIPKRAKKKKAELEEDIIKNVNLNKRSRIALGNARYSDEATLIKTNFDSHEVGLVITDLESRMNIEFLNGIIKWVKSKNNLFVFKIDSIEVDLIKHLASGINAVIIPLIPNVYLKNEKIAIESMDYFKTIEFPKGAESFCIDRQHTYERNPKNEVITIHNSPKALNHLRKKLYALHKNRIRVQDVDTQTVINKIISITNFYIGSFLIPPLLHLPIQLSEGYPPERRYTSKGGKELVNILSSRINHLKPEEFRYCCDVIDTHNSIYRIISESKRYKRDFPYSGGNKTYELLQLIENESKKDFRILVVTVNKHERLEVENVIRLYHPLLFEDKNIDVMTQENAYRSENNYDLAIFSSRLDKYYRSLSIRYNNSVILGYACGDAEFAEAQIKYSTEADERLISFYNESISDIESNLNVEGFLSKTELDCNETENRDQDDDLGGTSTETLHTHSGHNINENDPMNTVLNSFKSSVKRHISRKELDEDEEIGLEIVSEAATPESINEHTDDVPPVDVRLTNISTNETYNFQLSKNKEYVFYDLHSNKNDIIVSTLNDEMIGMGIILLGDDKRSTLQHLAAEVYGRDDILDEMIIDMWKDEVRNITLKHGDKARLYKKYKEMGGNITYAAFNRWLDLNVIAPQKAVDLKLLGEVLESENIISYYELIFEEAEKLRTLRRIVGRQFNKIIASIARKDYILDPDLEYMRQFFIDKIFRIDEIL